jgi:DnaJ-class molecular chaperone
MNTIKKICPACTGHGGVWGGSLSNATQCDVCDGRGNLLLNVCVECEREFDLANEIDHAEWLYGHDCEEL